MSAESIFEEVSLNALSDAASGLDEAQLARLVEGGALTEAIASVVPAVSEVVVGSLFKAAPDMLAERAGPEAVTRDQVRRLFGPGFDICEMVLRIAHEMGEEFTEEEFGDGEAIPILPYALAHLLARTCRIAEEALLLLKHGWPGRLRALASNA